MEKKLLEKMKKYQELAHEKDAMQYKLSELMRYKFPNIVDVFFNDSSIEIATEKHVIRRSLWSDNPTEPRFVCDNPKMPETIEEFAAMKKYLEDDKQQCLTAYYWLSFRYDFGQYK